MVLCVTITPVGFVDPSGLAFAPAAPVVVEGLDVLFNLFILALGLEAASSGPKAQPLDPGIFGDVLGDIAIGTIGAVGGDSVLQITKFVSDIQTKAKDNTERFKESKGKYQLGFIFNGELIRSHKKHDIMEAYGILSTGQIASDVLGGALPQIASFLGIDVSSITNKEYNDFINDLHWGVYTNNQMDAKLLAETLGLDHHDDAPSLGKYAEIHGDGHYQHYHSKLKGGTSVHIWYGGKKLLR